MKKIFNIFFVIILLILLTNNVYATEAVTHKADICYNGDIYAFLIKDNNPDFGNLYADVLDSSKAGLNSSCTSSKSNCKYYSSSSGKTYSYYKLGKYSVNSTQKCYVYYQEKGTSSTGNGYTSSKTNYNYITKMCGNRYSTDSIELVSQTTNDDGLTELVWELTGTSDLKNEWDRLNISITYNGNPTIGSCSKRTKDNKKQIVCSGIGPYISKTSNKNNGVDANQGTIENSPFYEITLKLDNIYTRDFKEEVSESIKQGYVNSCGGSNESIYLGTLNPAYIPSEDDIEVSNPAVVKDTDEWKQCQKTINLINKSGASDDILKKYMPECYSDSKISYAERRDLLGNLKEKYNSLVQIYSTMATGLSGLSKEENLMCDSTYTIKEADESEVIVNKMGIPLENEASMRFDSKIVYENFDKEYWGMVCVEDYYIDGGDTALVAAGKGFDYYNKIQINKTCSIVQKKKVTLKDKCQEYTNYDLRCDHAGDGVYGSDDLTGGPTDSFDACVQECDGGKYTQQCINTCYGDTYNNERSNNMFGLSKNYNAFNNTNKTTRLTSSSTDLYQSSATCTIDSINGTCSAGPYTLSMRKVTEGTEIIQVDNVGPVEVPATNYIVEFKKDGVVVKQTSYWALCNKTCAAFINYYKGPSGCVDDPETQFNIDVSKSKSELESLIAIAKAKSEVSNYTISITDSKSGVIYKVSGNSLETSNVSQPQLEFEYLQELSEENSSEYKKNIKFGANKDSASDGKYVTSTVTTTVYNVKIPKAYIKLYDSSDIVVENMYNNTYYTFKNIKNDDGTRYYEFLKKDGFDKSIYTAGLNYYYTDIKSPITNVVINPYSSEEEYQKKKYAKIVENGKTYYYVLNQNRSNIHIDFEIGGVADGFKSFEPADFYCYYGVYPSPLVKEDDPDSSIPTPTSTTGTLPTPTSTSIVVPGIGLKGGLRYYYREIKLNDVFPNGRNPRWNWSGTVNADGSTTGAAVNNKAYMIDPIRLTSYIENRGDDVYFDPQEIDYEFTMTPALIQDIREYNKSTINDGGNRKITYLDFSLVAAESSKKNYSKKVAEWYSNSTATLGITDCNNTYNGSCYNFDTKGGVKDE